MKRQAAAVLLLTATLAAGCSSPDPLATPSSTVAPTADQPSDAIEGSGPALPRATAGARLTGSPRTLVTPPVGKAPATPFAITERHLDLQRGRERPLPTTVWAPTAAQHGPFPLVLFSHGLTSEPSAYASVLTAWAKAGFVVAAPAYPHTAYGVARFNAVDVANQPADASYVISQLVGLNATAGDPLEGRIDISRIAAAGHSAGAITTIGLFTGSRDDRLDAGIVMAGDQLLPGVFNGPPAALLFVHGKLDDTVPYAAGLATFQKVPWSRAMLTVPKGGHVAITKDFTPVIATTTDFLRWSLYGDAAARARLDRDATRGGLATLTDQL